jgi:hypothetical protein
VLVPLRLTVAARRELRRAGSLVANASVRLTTRPDVTRRKVLLVAPGR